MNTASLWEMRDRVEDSCDEARLPPVARRLVSAVRTGSGGGLFPPVVKPGPEQTVAVDGWLGGASDARVLAAALAEPRFEPLLAMLSRMDAWCAWAARRYAAVVAHGVLDVMNAELFGPMLSESFVACAAGRARYTRRYVAEWGERHQEFLTLFLDRLARDLGSSSWPDEVAYRGPVVGLWAHGEETHNGRQRVLRVDCAGGARVAYKPRPASGDLLFAASRRRGSPEPSPESLFALLNDLPMASGEVRLPVLSCWTGQGDDRNTYLWQEWIEPPTQWGTIRESGPWRMRGTRLSPDQAAQFWHRAGSLAATLFASGIIDMIGTNLVAGVRPDDNEPLLYPIDLEIYFCRVTRLYDTGLLFNPVTDRNHHHVGLENTARWCSPEGPPVCWLREPGGTLRLHNRQRALTRTETRTVVADTTGGVGYGPHLPAMLRGMFDAWTLMCRHRSAIEEFLDRVRGEHRVRVLRQPTFRYFDALMPRWLSGGGATPTPAEPEVHFDRSELDQLRRMDVPYFFRSLAGGPVLRLVSPRPFRTARVAAEPPPGSEIGTNLDLAGLGVALRDAVQHVFDDVREHVVDDPSSGVRLHLQSPTCGQVGFDWPETGRRVTYSWNDATVRLRIEPVHAPMAPAEPVPAGEIRRRLLRMDRVDGELRAAWAAGGMVDTATARRLRMLTDAGIAWLADVVRDHGWPGRTMVGTEAACAASRLVQHTSEHLGFRKHCLRLMREAAETGDMPWREVAYLTDALRLDDGQPQVYGTKFHRVDGNLVPCPLEAPDEVDERRAAMGMEPLARHADLIRQRFRRL